MDLHNISLLQSALKTIVTVCDKTVDCSDCPFLACPIVPVTEWQKELDNAFQIGLKRTKKKIVPEKLDRQDVNTMLIDFTDRETWRSIFKNWSKDL